MRESARASIMALPGGSVRSTLYSQNGSTEETQLPIVQNTALKSSGLRHHLSDDGSSDNDDRFMMQPAKALPDGRF